MRHRKMSVELHPHTATIMTVNTSPHRSSQKAHSRTSSAHKPYHSDAVEVMAAPLSTRSGGHIIAASGHSPLKTELTKDELATTNQISEILQYDSSSKLIPFLRIPTASFLPSLQMLWSMCWPNALTNLIQFGIQFASIIFVGRLGAAQLAGSSLGNMFANVTGNSVGMGMASALDTLVSQSYGAKQYSLVGLHTQRGMFVLTLLCIPVAVVWLFTEQFLLALQMPSDVSENAGIWTRLLIIGVWPYFMFECLRRYLQGQRVLWPIVVAATVAAVINIVFNVIFVMVLDYQLMGSALATALSNWVSFITLTICILGRSKYRQRQRRRARALSRDNAIATANGGGQLQRQPSLRISQNTSSTATHSRDGSDITNGHQRYYPSSDSEMTQQSSTMTPGVRHRVLQLPQLQTTMTNGVAISQLGDPDDTWPAVNIREILYWTAMSDWLRLGVPGAASQFVEQSSYEAAAFLAGLLGTTPLAAHSIFQSTSSLWYSFPFGFANSTAALVGNSLGSGDWKQATVYVKQSILLVTFYAVAVGGIFTQGLRTTWGQVFSTDPDVLDNVSHAFWAMWIYGMFDANKAVLMAVLRGCGRPTITVIGNTAACLLVTYPLAGTLLFLANGGLTALWLSMAAGWATCVVIYATIVARTDWPLEVKKAQDRNKAEDVATMIARAITPHTRAQLTQRQLQIEQEQDADLIDYTNHLDANGNIAIIDAYEISNHIPHHSRGRSADSRYHVHGTETELEPLTPHHVPKSDSRNLPTVFSDDTMLDLVKDSDDTDFDDLQEIRIQRAATTQTPSHNRRNQQLQQQQSLRNVFNEAAKDDLPETLSNETNDPKYIPRLRRQTTDAADAAPSAGATPMQALRSLVISIPSRLFQTPILQNRRSLNPITPRQHANSYSLVDPTAEDTR